MALGCEAQCFGSDEGLRTQKCRLGRVGNGQTGTSKDIAYGVRINRRQGWQISKGSQGSRAYRTSLAECV